MAISSIQIRPAPSNPSRGILVAGSLRLPCALGRGGIVSQKREGDGATPIIATKPIFGFYRKDREPRPISPLPFLAIRKDMGWCDATDHPSYNRRITLPFDASHESMWRDDALYDLVIVLDINISERRKGCGSALFMHVARTGYSPTEGCIALKKQDLRKLLKVMSTHTRISILWPDQQIRR